MTRFRDPSQGLTVHRLVLTGRHIETAVAALVGRSDVTETALSLRADVPVSRGSDIDDGRVALGARIDEALRR